MALLKEVQAKVPSATTIAGRVIAFHEGRHLDLGEYAGDGVVRLSTDGEAIMKPVDEQPKQALGLKKPAG